ncbi:MAG: hypothetical protein IJT14_01845 [Rickettsiales bacterium]|nr:hypothetical protein [Rickettsiales bacterium]
MDKLKKTEYTCGNDNSVLNSNVADKQKEQKEKRGKENCKNEYFGKFNQPGYTWGNANIESITNNVDNQKEPMDSVRKKNNHINNYTSALTYESTGIDSNNTYQTYQYDTNDYNNLENLDYSVINQNNTNFLDSSYEDYLGLNNYNSPNNNNSNEFDGFSLESYEQPSYTYDDCSFSSKPDKQHNYKNEPWNQEYAEVKVISDNNDEKNFGYSSNGYGYNPNDIYTKYLQHEYYGMNTYTPQDVNSNTQYNKQVYNQTYYPYNWYF